jgi:AcrR family transcriptional regulator
MSSPTTAQGAAHRTGMHRRILRAAERCFAAYGPSRTTMIDVAREAGVSRPTVYRYFRDRDAVVIEVVVRRLRAALDYAARVIDPQAHLGVALLKGITLLVARGREDVMIRTLVVEEDQDFTGVGVWSAALALSAEFWEPLLVAARERQELREGLDVGEVCAWLAELLQFLVSRSDRDGALDTEVMVRQFIVPALLADPEACLTT